MAFSLSAPHWHAWQMLPGYQGERCVPYFSPIHITRVQPLKTGNGWLRIDFFNAFYEGRSQDFSMRLKVMHRGANFLVARIGDESGDDRVGVISHIEFAWLQSFCPRLIAAFPPESLGHPFESSISYYLDGVFFQNPPLPPQPRCLNSGTENAWLTTCALRFDGYACAKARGMEDQPSSFCCQLLHGEFPVGSEERMTAMFMLQRYLMKEGVRSKSDKGWRWFRILFLELCGEPVPECYQGPWHNQWVEEFVPLLTAGKALIHHLHSSCDYDGDAMGEPTIH